jgi:hypothetical protein
MLIAKNWPVLDRRKVKAQRVLAGYLNGEVIAEKLRVSKSVYYRWELGHRIPPTELKKLAALLGVPEKKLLA